MGKYCQVCNKGPMGGNRISHSHRKSRRVWAPNIQKVNAIVDGAPVRLHVCTRCLRSGKVQRAL